MANNNLVWTNAWTEGWTEDSSSTLPSTSGANSCGRSRLPSTNNAPPSTLPSTGARMHACTHTHVCEGAGAGTARATRTRHSRWRKDATIWGS
jgi:hypothetical protein